MAYYPNDARLDWTKVIGVAGLFIAVTGIVVTFTVPEVRKFFNLDHSSEATAIDREQRATQDTMRKLQEERAKEEERAKARGER